MGLWKAFSWSEPTQSWIFGILGSNQVDGPTGAQRRVDPNTGYLHVMMRSMRVPVSRRGWNAYCGALHCFSKLQYKNQPLAEFHALATPAKLKELSPENVAKIEMGEARLLGPIPYRGGDFALDLGLFSAKTSLAGPYLALLGKVAAATGIGAVANALGLIQAFREGIDGLSGGSDTTLEIGVSNTFEEVLTGCYVLAGLPQDKVKMSDLRVDATSKLWLGGAPVTAPYVIFTIDATTRRDDFATLPDVGDAYRAINDLLLAGDQVKARSAFESFRLRTLLSPDLLRADAERIVADVEADIKALLKPTTTGMQTAAPTLAPLENRSFADDNKPAGTAVAPEDDRCAIPDVKAAAG